LRLYRVKAPNKYQVVLWVIQNCQSKARPKYSIIVGVYER
jgi:hypothetical protein